MPDGDLGRRPNAPCYWCGSSEHLPKDCPMKDEEKLKLCFRKLADELLQGDYIGTERGEVNVCLNVIHFYRAFEEAANKLLPFEQVKAIRDEASKIRAEKYGRLLW